MRQISRAKGRDISPGNLFAPPTNMGWRGVFAAEIGVGIRSTQLPIPRRYPIIVKSGKDIQPFFINPLQTALVPR